MVTNRTGLFIKVAILEGFVDFVTKKRGTQEWLVKFVIQKFINVPNPISQWTSVNTVYKGK